MRPFAVCRVDLYCISISGGNKQHGHLFETRTIKRKMQLKYYYSDVTDARRYRSMLTRIAKQAFRFRSAWQTAIFRSSKLNVYFLYFSLIKPHITQVVSSCIFRTHFMRKIQFHSCFAYNPIIILCHVLSRSCRCRLYNICGPPYSSIFLRDFLPFQNTRN